VTGEDGLAMNLNDPISLALLTAEHLTTAGVEYALCGGLALAAYGQPRETKDADISVLEADGEAVANALETSGVMTTVTFERVQFGGLLLSGVTLLGEGTIEGLNMVDLIQPRSERFAHEVLSRSIEAPLRDELIHVVSPEDFILLKVLSTRDKDIDDAASVQRRDPTILDGVMLAREIAQLALEIPDHPVEERWAAVSTRVAAPQP
jgi:hypothetical protein